MDLGDILNKYSVFAKDYGRYSIHVEDSAFSIETLELGRYRVSGFHGRGGESEYDLEILEKHERLPENLENQLAKDVAKIILENNIYPKMKP